MKNVGLKLANVLLVIVSSTVGFISTRLSSRSIQILSGISIPISAIPILRTRIPTGRRYAVVFRSYVDHWYRASLDPPEKELRRGS
jgi:hypothetical protein